MERAAFLKLDGWAGRVDHPVTVIGETPKRYRIRNDQKDSICLAGRYRYLDPGKTALVPKYAIRFKV